MFRTKSDPVLDLDLVTTKKTGVVRKVAGVATLPFRLVGGAVRAVVTVVRAVVLVVLIPIRVGIAVIRRVVLLASDILFALWRLVLGVLGLAVGAVRLVFRLVDATIGNVIRLVLKIVLGTLKLVLKIVTFGRFGRAAAVGAAGAAVAAKSTAADD